MIYDLTREALLYPQKRPVFTGEKPSLPPDLPAFSPAFAWHLANVSHAAYYDEQEALDGLAEGGLELCCFAAAGSSYAVLARASRYAVLAFRGTEADDIEDYLTDGDFRFAAAGGVAVHRGFLAALNQVWPQLEGPLAELPGDVPLCCTGHSLGGALAQLAALRVQPDLVCTFGAPRVGDRSFAAALADLPVCRVENCCDIVPNLPVEAVGYVSVGRQAYVDADGGLRWDVPFAEVLVERGKAEMEYTAELSVFHPDKLLSRWMVDHSIVNYAIAMRLLAG